MTTWGKASISRATARLKDRYRRRAPGQPPSRGSRYPLGQSPSLRGDDVSPNIPATAVPRSSPAELHTKESRTSALLRAWVSIRSLSYRDDGDGAR